MRYDDFLRRYPLSQFDPEREFPEPEWLIEDLWLGGGKINGLFGTPKAGKSRMLGWMLAAMLGRKEALPGMAAGSVVPERILYLRAEESEAEIARRLQHYGKIQGSDTHDWRDRLLFQPGMDMCLERQSQRENMEKLLQDNLIELLIIDPYVRIHAADENDATQMAVIHNTLRRWSDRHGLDIIIVHHTGKLIDELVSQTDISRWARGSSDIAAILDAGALLHRMGKGNELQLFRSGRFATQPRLKLLDGGDSIGFSIAN